MNRAKHLWTYTLSLKEKRRSDKTDKVHNLLQRFNISWLTNHLQLWSMERNFKWPSQCLPNVHLAEAQSRAYVKICQLLISIKAKFQLDLIDKNKMCRCFIVSNARPPPPPSLLLFCMYICTYKILWIKQVDQLVGTSCSAYHTRQVCSRSQRIQPRVNGVSYKSGLQWMPIS